MGFYSQVLGSFLSEMFLPVSFTRLKLWHLRELPGQELYFHGCNKVQEGPVLLNNSKGTAEFMLHCKWEIKVKYIHLGVMSEWQYPMAF